MSNLDNAFSEAVVVRQHELPAGTHLLDRRWPNKSTGFIRDEYTSLFLGCTDPVLQTSFSAGQRRAWTKLGVDNQLRNDTSTRRVERKTACPAQKK